MRSVPNEAFISVITLTIHIMVLTYQTFLKPTRRALCQTNVSQARQTSPAYNTATIIEMPLPTGGNRFHKKSAPTVIGFYRESYFCKCGSSHNGSSSTVYLHGFAG